MPLEEITQGTLIAMSLIPYWPSRDVDTGITLSSFRSTAFNIYDKARNVYAKEIFG